MRILLIDDHALFRIGLSELLERRGIEVIAAVSGCEEGLSRVVETQPDVTLLDMRMPEMTGLQVLERLSVGTSTCSGLEQTCCHADHQPR